MLSLSGPSDASLIDAGARRLGAHFDVRVDPRAYGRLGYLAGGDLARAQSLIDALNDPSIGVIFCARGGYGITRILETQHTAISHALQRNPKTIVGFSDVTALHALWYRHGVRSVHGPMVSKLGTDGAVSPDDFQALLDCLSGNTRPMRGLTTVQGGGARGPVVGGNLAMITALLATPHQYPLDGAVLFLEDIGERPYRLDRMLTQLRSSGALDGVVAVVLGQLSDCTAGPDGVTAEQVIHERLSDLKIPVYCDAPFGHGSRAQSFAIGDIATLDAAGELEFALADTVC